MYLKNLDKSKLKPDKIWQTKVVNFNRSTKLLLHDNDIEMYSKHNEGNSVAAGKCVKTLQNKIYRYMTSISKQVYLISSMT